MKVVGLSSAFAVGLAAVALANHVPPVHYGDEATEENNPSCAFFNPDWNELKIDQAPNGEFSDSGGADNPGGDGPLVFKVQNSDGKTFNWESNMPVDAVVVKGGNRGSNVYMYGANEAKSDTGLHSPNNSQGKRPAVSHISACYDTRAQQQEQEQLQEEEPQQLEQAQQEDQPQQEAGAESSKADPLTYGDGAEEENNPSCASLDADWNELKINEAPNGEFRDEGGADNPGGDGPLVFTVKRSDGKVFEWESNIGVDAVVVKGGNRGSNVYIYDPEEILDKGLQSPLNSQGNVPAVSHISACYDTEPEAQQEQQEAPREEQPPQEDPPQEEPPQEEPPQDEGGEEQEQPQQQAQEEGSAVDPVVYGDGEGEENNPSCEFLDSSWKELKISDAPNGEYRDGPLVFTVENSDGKVFDWESNIGVDAVVVKGGNVGSNVYFYDPEALSDSRLRSPDNTQGNTPAVSHISVCYDVEEAPGEQEEPPQEQPPQEEPPQDQGEEEEPQEEEQPEDEGGEEEDNNERPAEPDEPQEGEQPQEEGGEQEQPQDDAEDRTDEGGTNERQAEPEEQQDEGTEEEATEDEVQDDEGESDVEGVSETDDGEADDLAEETSPGSDDDSGSGGDLPFTGAPLGVLLLIGVLLTLVGAVLRAAQRTKSS